MIYLQRKVISLVKYDEKGNRIIFQNLREEKVLEFVKNYYGYENFISYEDYVVNTVTGEIVAKLKFERGMYNLLSREAS